MFVYAKKINVYIKNKKTKKQTNDKNSKLNDENKNNLNF